jgi:hypothetical protein
MNTFSTAVFDCNKEMVESDRTPNTNFYLMGKGSEMKNNLNKISRIQQMMFDQRDNPHIVWLLYCEEWYLIRDQRSL